MITLHTFGPGMGAPDASPFVLKTMLLLKLAGLQYLTKPGVPFRAPKKMLPYIEDDGVTVADSSFIRLHIEAKYGHRFDATLDARQQAIAWAVEKMCEEHLYWGLIDLRWGDPANFERGVGKMLKVIPAPIRLVIKPMIRRNTLKRAREHGMGRHSQTEIAELSIRDIDTLATLIGEQEWLMGNSPCGADASVFGILTALMTPELDSPIVAAALGRANLVAYRDRILARYFPAG